MRISKRTNRIYARLENDLRQDILASRLSDGEALPTEKELSESYGVSRNTVRHALANLVEEGLLKKVHGSGTFVVPVEERSPNPAEKPKQNQILFLSLSSAMSEVCFRSGGTFEPIFTGLNRILQKKGYNLLLTQVGMDWTPPPCLCDGNICGIVFHGPVDLEFWRKFIRPYPNIGIQYPRLELDTDFVVLDNYAFSKLSLEYLVRHGHRRIAFLSDEIENQLSRERFEGYLRGMKELGLPLDERYQLVWQRPYNADGELPNCPVPPDYRPWLEPVFTAPDPPTAIVCIDDSRAAFAQRALEKMGLKVPDDVSLTGGYNTTEWRTQTYSGIDTMLDEICSEAAGLLLEQIENPAESCCKNVMIRPKLAAGNSVKTLNGEMTLQVGI